MLEIAKILKSNGTDGGLLIGLRDVSPEDIDIQEPVFIQFDGLPVPFFILDIAPKGSSKAVIHLNDVENLEDAEELVGCGICAELELEEDARPDFSGWTILDKGRKIGICSGMEPIPGNPLLRIGELLIPLHEDLMLSADPDKKILDLDLPEGLC